MALVRGSRGLATAYASQVHPVFMLPPLAASGFGAVLAGTFAPVAGGLHAVAVFCAVYTAHVKDGFVDFHVRGEDDDHPLTRRGCRLGLVAATALFALSLVGLWLVVGVGAALVTLPTWVVGYLHAPQLDTDPFGATLGYPVGIGVAVVGGHYVQAGGLAGSPLAFAAVFVLLLAGVKVIDDAKDFDYDRSIDKRTVAVVLGRRRARALAYVLMLSGLGLVVGLAVGGLFPPGTLLAALAFAVVAGVARRAGPELATKLLIRGAYVFLALLLVAVWFRPLS